MGTVSAVGGLFGGQAERFFHQIDIEIQQDGAVKQKKAFLAALGVAAKLDSAYRQIRVPLHLDPRPQKAGEAGAVPAHDVLVCRSDTCERASRFDLQDEGVVENSRAL